jgi:aminopeptidase-like protein
MEDKLTIEKINNLAQILYPICRSITGNGVRDTLKIINESINLDISEIPTGTKVLDWEIPQEWNIRDAYIMDAAGNRVVDFKKHNLHVVNYSEPVNKKMNLEDLKDYLHTLPDFPDLIPYKTSYYQRTWGFCLTEKQKQGLSEGLYDVVIDSDIRDGSLTYAEFFIPGKTDAEILFSTHVCHPSLANDNLSGIIVQTLLAQLLNEQKPLNYSYRFLFVPGTIGAITWLAHNEAVINNIQHGLVISGVGDAGNFTFKKSRRESAFIDKTVEYVLSSSFENYTIENFSPYGYDERQYCSPGYNLPVGRISRTPYGTYHQYHTSADNLSFINASSLHETIKLLSDIVNIIEKNAIYLNKYPKGEPQLGRRGIYGAMGGYGGRKDVELAILWILNQSDGKSDLLSIAEKSNLSFKVIVDAAEILLEKDLIGLVKN